MAGQSIKLKIAGKEYCLVAQTPEAESYMRNAAESINKMLQMYDQRFPDASLQDKLAFVALNETVSMLMSQRKLAVASEESKRLNDEISSYLEKIV